MILTLDVSAAIEAVMRRPRQMEIVNLLKRAKLVIAPSLYVYEAANVMWKYYSIGSCNLDQVQNRIRQLHDLVDEFVDAQDLYQEGTILACQINHPAYDAMYLVASRRSGATLVTLDSRLRSAAIGLNIPVAF